jgi:hypothetical protein
MEHRERRLSERMPVGLYVQQIIDGDTHRCFATNISLTGIYVEHLSTRFIRRSRTVQLEIPLTGESDAIWASGEVVYDALDRLFVGTAIRFDTMAERDHRRLERWLDHGAMALRDRPIWFSPAPPSRRLH